jgi:DNA modification methylase
MKTTNLPLEKLIAYAGNPRRNDHAVEAVAAAIKRFGFRVPVLAKSDGSLIDGHLRIKAAKRLGMTEVPVVLCDDLSEAEIKALRISINRMAELAEWDEELLMAELEGLAAEGITMDDVGFDLDALEALGASVEPEGNPESDAEPQIDKAEELRAKWGVEPGQLWELGDHRLLCGDSTKKEDVERVMGGDKPLLMVTDPPYGVEYDADWRNDAAQAGCAKFGRGAPGAKAVGIVYNDDKADWQDAYVHFQGDVAYVWHAALHAGTVAEGLSQCGFLVRSQIIWSKSMHIISRGHYHWKHEPCWYAVRKGKTASWAGDRSQCTLWQIDRARASETGHSTQKPVECMARPIRNHDSEFVYEPFSGSGTTIIACEHLGRKCRAIEISPGYVAVALQRWADATGKTPSLVP